ncbi:hypothetical protein KJ969_02030 [Patescibacteria group bacterium]|nr:hypothetical protein [Patescibacteria group bacterium]MBU1921666.1 hypothetical protein [Patescibacteria group bacterium]
MIARIIIGLIIVAAGVAMVMRTQWFMSIVGQIAWAEAHLGGGGSRALLKIIGLALIFIGFLVVTNMWESVIVWILGPLFPGTR